MPYSIQHIAEIISEVSSVAQPGLVIDYLLTDSRRVVFPSATLFFALQSKRNNGEAFIEELYKAGVRSFVVTKTFDHSSYPEGNFLKSSDPLRALQKLAAYHRKQFNIPVIGITGSNGKTIVKEWIFHLLQADYNIVRSPKSYNSQIGVPLGVWQMNETNTLAIFEAGISLPGEMNFLEEIICPSIGILTNIGAAHASGFASQQEKLVEKWKLFTHADTVITNNKKDIVQQIIDTEKNKNILTWGNEHANLEIINIEKKENSSIISAKFRERNVSIIIGFTDNASIENALTCWLLLLFLKINDEVIAERMKKLQPVEMRLQLKKATNNCSLINDSYSNDLSSLRIALDFLHQQSFNQKTTVILSDLGEMYSSREQYKKVLSALLQHKINRFIGIGPMLFAMQEEFKNFFPAAFFYQTTEDFLRVFRNMDFRDEVILLKGARAFEFERIDLLFQQKVHQTVLEVNLTAMAHNLKEYQRHVQPSTKVMAMVKAFGYGSGSSEIASLLQYHKLDYLAVAYADEGVDLRKAGIQMPLMVMNAETVTFSNLIEYNLEPELYSFSILQAFNNYLLNEGIQQFPVHIKIDTGMHRLGFEAADSNELAAFLQQNPRLVVKSVFSHLAASESAEHDEFTHAQVMQFLEACVAIEHAIGYSFILHIANSAAIFRHPEFQFDMVRLGIGLYGVDSIAQSKLTLLPVATLKSTIAQIRKVKMTDTIGYSRKGILYRDSMIATIRIGYADGFSRKMGNGKGKVLVNGQLAPVVGSVCMDMTMIDITDIKNVNEGDSVEIFGSNLSIVKIAHWCQTIPYEIMTGISQRVKREYYEE